MTRIPNGIFTFFFLLQVETARLRCDSFAKHSAGAKI